jgi:hypothetical protein
VPSAARTCEVLTRQSHVTVTRLVSMSLSCLLATHAVNKCSAGEALRYTPLTTGPADRDTSTRSPVPTCASRLTANAGTAAPAVVNPLHSFVHGRLNHPGTIRPRLEKQDFMHWECMNRFVAMPTHHWAPIQRQAQSHWAAGSSCPCTASPNPGECPLLLFWHDLTISCVCGVWHVQLILSAGTQGSMEHKTEGPTEA